MSLSKEEALNETINTFLEDPYNECTPIMQRQKEILEMAARNMANDLKIITELKKPVCTYCKKTVNIGDVKTLSKDFGGVLANRVYHMECMKKAFDNCNESKAVDVLPPPLPFITCILCHYFILPDQKYESVWHTCGQFDNEMRHHNTCIWTEEKCACGRDHEIVDTVETPYEDWSKNDGNEWPDIEDNEGCF